MDHPNIQYRVEIPLDCPAGLSDLILQQLRANVGGNFTVAYVGEFAWATCDDPAITERAHEILRQTAELWQSSRYALAIIRKRFMPTDQIARLRFKRTKSLLETLVAVGAGIAVADDDSHPGNLRLGPMSLITDSMRTEIGNLAVELIDLLHPESERRDCQLCRKARRGVHRRLAPPKPLVS